VHLKKDVNQRTEKVRDTVRRSDVHVEDTTGRRDFAEATDDDPAYRYGYDMASDQRYRGRRWDEVENDLRTDYARRYPNSTWEQTKANVRRGWEKMTGHGESYAENATARRDFTTTTTDDDPDYRYGYDMASDARYRGRRWDDVENDLRTDYARRYPNSTWEQTKASVRRGWDKVTGRV